MRHERDRRAELLLDLRGVTMIEHTVRRQTAVALAEMRPLGRGLPRARDAGLRVDDDGRSAQVDEPAFDERLQREDRRRRVAARACDECRVAQLIAIPLGQAIDDGLRRVDRLRIPAVTKFCIAKPKGPGEIENALAERDERRSDLGGRVLGEREKDRVGLFGQQVDVQPVNRRVPQPLQCRYTPGRGARRSHRRGNAHAGMPAEQAQQLDAGITGRPRNANSYCTGISIHQNV